jgi:tetratricopeptide (TPR) repeat protein
VVARFEAERQALALMDHPNIAKVLDGGTTDSGRPYFVMELVKGVPITDYCDQNRVSIRERLELFASVCQAVQHAHQKGIIHRDIKPSNVLITLHDGMPVVKVIDFGVAKAVGQQLTDKTIYTQFSQMVGTPLYMSPEQAWQSGLDVDTRTDIYGLGVLLYELLTGTTPFDKERLSDVGYDEMRRIIREEEPPKPSTRISTLGQAATTVSTQRQSEPKRLSRLLRGELDWIVMKALEKDRDRRYETANGLAMDVQRYLHDEPVLACPPSSWYRFRKIARRQKTALLAVAGVVLALTGIAASIGWAVRDRGAREEALDQTVARTLTEVIEPLLAEEKWSEALAAVNRADELLAAAGRTERPQRLVQLREELGMVERLEAIPRAKGEAKTRGAIVGDPEYRPQPAGLSEDYYFRGWQPDENFAEVFRAFGIDVDALTPEEAAAQIQRRSVHPALVKALDEWAPLRRSARGESNAGWKKLVAIARLADPPDPWRNRCREAFLRRDRQALEQLAQTIPIRQVTPKTLWLLALTLKEVGAPEQAVELLRRAQHEYPDDLWINDTLGHFSLLAFKPPRTEDALRYFSIALSLRPSRPQLHFMVGVTLWAKGAFEEGVVEFSKALELDPSYSPARAHLYVVLRAQGKFEEYIAECRKAIELHPNDARAHYNLACVLRTHKKLDEAVAELRRTIELDPKDARLHSNLGDLLRDQKKQDEAIAEYRKAIELDPKDAAACIDLGNALEVYGDLPGAVSAYQKAMALNPALAKELLLDVFPARYYVQRSQWDKAAAEYAKVDLGERPLNDDSFAYACLLLIRGDSEGYNRFCQGMIQRAAQTENPWEAYTLARSCAMARKSPVDPARAVQWAKKIVANEHSPWCFHVLGLAQYRAGQFDQALQSFTKANVKAWRYSELNWFPLALVHHRLGHPDEARQCLDKGIQWLKREGPPSPERPAKLLPQDWIEAQLLRREAEEMLKIKQSP